MKTVIKDKRAISPVIATVILVAVAITVAVAVSYWMSGIAGMYTKFEKVAIESAYAPKITGGDWNITMILKNTGSANSTLTTAFVNDKPITSYSPAITFWYSTDGTAYHAVPSTGITIASGQGLYIILTVDNTLFSSGTTLNVKLHSAGGMDYIKLVELQ